jgi:hypothetical protein
MFENEEFFSSESNTIDMHTYTNKIYYNVLGEAAKQSMYAEVLSDVTSS